MTTTEPMILLVPEDLDAITAIHDGHRWLRNIVAGSVIVSHGAISFVMNWRNDGKRRITLSLMQVTGYQTDA